MSWNIKPGCLTIMLLAIMLHGKAKLGGIAIVSLTVWRLAKEMSRGRSDPKKPKNALLKKASEEKDAAGEEGEKQVVN